MRRTSGRTPNIAHVKLSSHSVPGRNYVHLQRVCACCARLMKPRRNASSPPNPPSECICACQCVFETRLRFPQCLCAVQCVIAQTNASAPANASSPSWSFPMRPHNVNSPSGRAPPPPPTVAKGQCYVASHHGGEMHVWCASCALTASPKTCATCCCMSRVKTKLH